MNNIYKEELEVFGVVHFFTFLHFFFCAQKRVKGFLIARLYNEAKEYDLAKRYVKTCWLLSSPLLFLIKFQVSWQQFFVLFVEMYQTI